MQGAPYQFSTGHTWWFITAMAYLQEHNGHPARVPPSNATPHRSLCLDF